jgi:hypothetical protein
MQKMAYVNMAENLEPGCSRTSTAKKDFQMNFILEKEYPF